MVEKLQTSSELKDLLAAYANTVFRLGQTLKGAANSQELTLLADLQIIITELKTKHSNAWNFIWDYEYTEGFAEYVSAETMALI